VQYSHIAHILTHCSHTEYTSFDCLQCVFFEAIWVSSNTYKSLFTCVRVYVQYTHIVYLLTHCFGTKSISLLLFSFCISEVT